MGVQGSIGCVRMRNADIVELFDLVPAGTPVEILGDDERQASNRCRNVVCIDRRHHPALGDDAGHEFAGVTSKAGLRDRDALRRPALPPKPVTSRRRAPRSGSPRRSGTSRSMVESGAAT